MENPRFMNWHSNVQGFDDLDDFLLYLFKMLKRGIDTK